MDDQATLAFLRSIDDRLRELTLEVRTLNSSVIWRSECQKCQKQWLPKSTVVALGAMFAGISGLAAFIGDALGVITRFSGVR